MNRYLRKLIWVHALCLSAASFAQDIPADRVPVPLHDPSRPAVVKASQMSGGITVKGYEGKEVIVEARLRKGDASKDERTDDKKVGGLKRIEITTTGLTVEEENNVVNVNTGSWNRPVDLTIQVPVASSLKLNCMTEGEIRAEGIEGEIEDNNINGGVTLV